MCAFEMITIYNVLSAILLEGTGGNACHASIVAAA